LTLSHLSTAVAAGLLLSALWAGDIHRYLPVLSSNGAAGRNSTANAGSITFTADVED